ncbi:MAG: 1-acyl-sn-glycerol-3-phosphate acyltransferase [Planctomycetes bacterium]|nr:1-acyl-sn-glycerol-3-phosphate acyltransferase [Planctomycetota bacterium]
MSDERMLVDLTPLKGWRGFLYHGAVQVAAGIWRIMFLWKLTGVSNIPRQGSLIVISNHPSYLDPPSLVGLMIQFAGRDLSIMAWDKLFRVPLVSFWVKAYKAFPVDRSNPGRGPYQTLLRILQQGGAAGVFPEGSRSHGQLMGEWKPGALRAAFATKSTILPVTMVTTGEFWPRHAWRPRFFRRQEIVVHKPLTYEQYMADKPPEMHEKQWQDEMEKRVRAIINEPIVRRIDEFSRRKLELIEQRLPSKPAPDAAQARRTRLAEAKDRLVG